MRAHKRWLRVAVIAVAVVFTLSTRIELHAQGAEVLPEGGQSLQAAPEAQDGTASDPPSRVARLNYLEGSVSFQPDGEKEWVDAVLNRPLMTGDNLWADGNSRAEVHIGSTALRLGQKTGITLLEVSDHAVQIRLAQGSLILKVRHLDDADWYEIDTPNIAFVVMQPGDYRVDVDADGNRSEVTVWRGRGEVTGGGSSYQVAGNQCATFTGSDHLDYELAQIPDGDGLNNWAFERDRSEDASDSANYVSREMTGYEDLDQYGDWSNVDGYGTVWSPRVVAVGWAPYRYGHWTWIGPWGWTWVGDEAWGFAPYHYGRWALAGNGWVWVPGPKAARSVYAPGMVAWVGGAPGRSFSFGAGVGWFPLAPGEVFLPGYGVSRAYVNRVNITNTAVNVKRVTNVYNTVVVDRNANNVVYANHNGSGGVTVVSRDTFVNARPVGRNVQTVSARELAAAPVSPIVDVEPVRNSVWASGRVAGNRPPAAVSSRPVVAVRMPQPMPGYFAQRQAQAGGRVNQPLVGQPLVVQQPVGRPLKVSRPAPEADGFRSFTPSKAGSNQQESRPRVWEAQGDPQPEPSVPPAARGRQTQSSRSARSTQPSQPDAQPWSHSEAKAMAAVPQKNQQPEKQPEEKYSSWHSPQTSSPSSRPSSHGTSQTTAPPSTSHSSTTTPVKK
jgi:hypothetical protein